MPNILEKVKTGTIVLLSMYCAYLLYTRSGTIKQETKKTEEIASNTKTGETTKVDTVTIKKPNGEIIIKKTKVISKNTDKTVVSKKKADIIHETPLDKIPGLNNQPCYSLGIGFSVLPKPSTTPRNIELGYRVLGNAWLTTSVGLYKNPDITVGIRLEF